MTRCALQARSHVFHRRNALAWGNGRAGTDLTEQIDPDFVMAPMVTSTRA